MAQQIVGRERNHGACYRQLVADVVVSRRVNSNVVRLVFILLVVGLTAITSLGQQLEPCAKFKSPYRSLEALAITKVAAHFPPERGMRIKSKVLVLIKVDPNGHVVSARAICGHPLLVATPVSSARQWTFRPRRVRGKSVSSVGTITFEFGPDASSANAP